MCKLHVLLQGFVCRWSEVVRREVEGCLGGWGWECWWKLVSCWGFGALENWLCWWSLEGWLRLADWSENWWKYKFWLEIFWRFFGVWSKWEGCWCGWMVGGWEEEICDWLSGWLAFQWFANHQLKTDTLSVKSQSVCVSHF